MSKIEPPKKDLIEALCHFSTPTICNAIEMLRSRLQNEGYTDNNQNLINHNPQSQSMVGYAITLKMRTANPPMSGQYYADREDWWNMVCSMPRPRIAVIQDLDVPSGAGSIAGITHAIIFKALGCIGIVTNGALRDIPLIKQEKMHIYSRKLVPSHAYSHIVEVGVPVKIAGLTIKPGDLLHGDINGIVSVPTNNVEEILTNAHQVFEKKKKIIDFFHSKKFNLAELKKLVEEQ